jgi:hypothetical protein
MTQIEDTLQSARAILVRIDPENRFRWLDASIVLRGIGLEAQELWQQWSAPLELPEDVVDLWARMQPKPESDPLARLGKIASRKNDQ